MQKNSKTFYRYLPAFLLVASLTALAAVSWDALFDQDGGAAVHFGAALKGREPFQRNYAETFAPASNSKLFTAAAVLAKLGPDYRYPTRLRWQETGPGVASGLTMIGSGDPSWGLPQLGENIRTRVDLIADGLKKAGIHTVRGEVKAESSDPRWDVAVVPAGWEEHDTLSCGGSLALGFNFNTNCATFKVTATDDGAWLPAGLGTPMNLAIAEGAATNLRVKLVKAQQGLRFAISGTLKKGDTKSFTLPVLETRLWARNLLRLALEAKGIKLEASAGEEKGTPKELVFYSKPLSELLKPFLKNSVNFMGDAFLKATGANTTEAGGDLLAPSLSVLKDYLVSLGLPRDFVLNDGSGLSRTSRVSPAFLMEFLERMPREKFFPALLAALPVAGVDGTLRNRMKGTPAEGVLRAKTGTLEGVYNISGWVPQGREWVSFVILTKTTMANQNAARKAEDRVGAKLAELHRGPGASVYTEAPYPYVPEQAGMDDQ